MLTRPDADSRSKAQAPQCEPAGAPLVSVIVPAYNAQRYVLDALESIARQDYEPIEIIVVDDGSTDRTTELVRSRFPGVRILHQANAGAAAARNAGLREATGDYICFLDADDGWYPGKVRAQIEHLQRHPDVGMVFHDWRVLAAAADGLDGYGTIADRAAEIDPTQSGWIYHRLLLDSLVHTSTVMMRRKVFEEIGYFDTSLKLGEDYEYWLRVSRRYPIDKLRAAYSFYRQSSGGLTRSRAPLENYSYRVVRSAVERWGLSSPDGSRISKRTANRRLADLAFDHAYIHYHRGSLELAHGGFLEAFRRDPLRVKALVYLILSSFRRLHRAQAH